jgi:hypothetical protein
VPPSRLQFAAPPLSPIVKRLIIGLLCAYVAQLLLDNWLGVNVTQLLALNPGRPWVWQLVTYVLVSGSDPMQLLFGLLMLWWGLSPFELANGTKRTWQLCLVAILGASIPADLIGFVLPASHLFLGAGPLWLGAFTAGGWQNRNQRLSFWGVLPMTGLQFLLLLLAYSVLSFLWNKDLIGLVGDLGAMAAALVFARWLDRPAPRRPPRKASARGSGFKVIQGGGNDDDKPKWLN